jgi:penicillin-insensitive murein endopeptidase
VLLRAVLLRAVSLGAVSLGAGGCFGTPTPLAPGLAGSVGLPHHGVQTGSIELPERGPGFVRYRRAGSFYWAQPALIRAIEAASKRVEEQLPGGAPLVVGDLSAELGGKIPRHNSHRTGRDVDLLWYVQTPDGASIQNPAFVQLGPDGLGRLPDRQRFVRLDVPRQWLLVKALLWSDEVEVQWMFCSSDVEALLVDYALARGEPAEVVFRAQNVLMEPGDSLPHDDHIHLRTACRPDDTVRGCEGGGPYWSWLAPPPELGPLEMADLNRMLLEPSQASFSLPNAPQVPSPQHPSSQPSSGLEPVRYPVP